MAPKQRNAAETAKRLPLTAAKATAGASTALATLARVAVSARDPVITLYRTLLAYGVVGLVILTAGVVEFLHFEPFGGAGTPPAHIVGIYRYDPATGQTSGPDQRSFARDQLFAAVVDWSSLPDNITAQAVWYDGFGNVVGRVGPGTPSELKDHNIVPAEVPEGLKYHLPGGYIFAVERLRGDLPVEVLARRLVQVERT